jgi:hypothetical protein
MAALQPRAGWMRNGAETTESTQRRSPKAVGHGPIPSGKIRLREMKRVQNCFA